MRTYLLYIDESGQSYPTAQPAYPYIVTGVVVEQSKQDAVNKIFDELKRKYWGKTDVVLHSEDMGKNIKEFSIFRNKSALKIQFYDDLLAALEKAPFMCFHALLDKTKLPPTYLEKKVINRTATSVFFNFLCYLLTRPNNSRGKIIIEASSTFRDSEYLTAFSFFLSPGCKLIDSDFPSFEEIKSRLTQISFVTKLNHDNETQIADVLGYGAYCMFREASGASYAAGSYKHRLVKVLEKKQFHLPTGAGKDKLKLFKKIDSFDLL